MLWFLDCFGLRWVEEESISCLDGVLSPVGHNEFYQSLNLTSLYLLVILRTSHKTTVVFFFNHYNSKSNNF